MTKEYAESAGVSQDVAHGVIWAAVAAAVAMAITFLLTMFFYEEKENTEKESEFVREKKKIVIFSPVSGKVVKLADIEDEAFSDNSLGAGIAIDPSDGEIFSPADGIVSVLPETCHAVCITSDEGAMILIHVGFNTAELHGAGFRAVAKEGERVKAGDKIIEFDLEAIKGAGYSLVTPVVVGNSDEYQAISVTVSAGSKIEAGESIIEMK